MKILTIEEFGRTIGMIGHGRLMGLDVSEKNIGIAISDTGISIANAIGVVQRRNISKDAEALKRYIEKYRVVGLVIGYPLNANGTAGGAVRRVEVFANAIKGFLNLPICFWDERFSTAEAQEIMMRAGLSKNQRAKKVDGLAANYFLQIAIDYLNDNVWERRLMVDDHLSSAYGVTDELDEEEEDEEPHPSY